MVTFFQHFRPYLLGAPFTIRTDHGALSWIHKFKEPEGQIAQWVQKLQEYEFTIIHRPGIRHKNADAMSRIPCKQCGIIPVDEALALAAVTTPNIASLGEYSPEELRAAQLNDPGISLVLTAKESNNPETQPTNSPGDRRLWQLWEQLTVINGLLYRMFKEPNKDQHWFQLVVPQEHRPRILAALHEGVAGGHLGQEKTFSRVKERFYWPEYWSDTCN